MPPLCKDWEKPFSPERAARVRNANIRCASTLLTQCLNLYLSKRFNPEKTIEIYESWIKQSDPQSPAVGSWARLKKYGLDNRVRDKVRDDFIAEGWSVKYRFYSSNSGYVWEFTPPKNIEYPEL